jgi:lipopolysaccharide export LptBFGC system permease protein LptF
MKQPSIDDRRVRARIMISSSATLFVVTLLLASQPLVTLLRHVPLDVAILLVPQALPLSIPVALPFGLAISIGSRRLSRHLVAMIAVFAVAGTAMSFVIMGWVAPVANQSFRMSLVVGPTARDGRTKGLNELTLGQLRAHVTTQVQPYRPYRARDELSYYRRYALPCAPIVLAAAILVTRMGRASRRWQRMLAAIATCGVYYALMVIGEESAVGETVPALVGAWLPNMTLALLIAAMPSVWHRSPHGRHPAQRKI